MADIGAQSASSPAPATSHKLAPSESEAVLVEVDEAAEEDYPTMDEQMCTFTASLSSSVVDYPIEHGRQYHAYRKGSYLLPNDDRESERLDLTHIMMVGTMNGRLYLSPIDEEKVQNILDVGTGTGALAIELADAIPTAQVLGCDLSPTQHPLTPPNLTFEVDDVESEWTYPFTFDFIISRYMAGSINDWPKLVGGIYENLTPGGWAELQDFDLEYGCDDGSLTEEHNFWKWNKILRDGLSAIDRECYPGRKLRAYSEAAGFINIQEVKYKIPVGPWAKDPQIKNMGMLNLIQTLDGLDAFSLKIFEMLGYSRVETEVLLAGVRKELQGKSLHAYISL